MWVSDYSFLGLLLEGAEMEQKRGSRDLCVHWTAVTKQNLQRVFAVVMLMGIIIRPTM